MKDNDYLWIEANLPLFMTNHSWTREQVTRLFEIYSDISGRPQKPTGCGRCIATAKGHVYKQYQTEYQKRTPLL